MSQRSRFGLILVIALTALSLSVAAPVAGGDGSQRATGGEAFTRGVGDERRDSTSSDRSSKQRLALFATVAVLVWIAGSTRCRLVTLPAVARPVTTWWSPQAGRSPPPFSVSIA